MKKLFLVLLAICSVNVAGQNKTFFDDFDSKSTNWINLKNYNTFLVENGFMKIEHLKNKSPREKTLVNGSVFFNKKIDFTKDFNFELNTDLKRKNNFGFYYVIIWNYEDENNYFYLLTGKSSVTLQRLIRGKYFDLIKPEIKNGIKYAKHFKNVSNSYKKNIIIDKQNGFTKIYINNFLIYSGEIDGYSKNGRFGVSLPANQSSKPHQGGFTFLIEGFKAEYSESLIENEIIYDKTPPSITITSPNLNRGFSIVKNNKTTTISGTIADESKIYEVLINGQDAYVDSNGNFSKNVILGVGENTFTVKATDVHMNSTTKTFTIKREVEQTETTITNTTKINNTNSIETGKYYALIIGNNEYTDNAISTLDEPIKDATKLYNILTSKYSFSPQNVTFLKNATYVQMIDAFDKLSNTLTKKDNLLVFYAGHGWWDKKKNLGYWLPSNAKQSSTAFWIRNSTISDYMASIKSKHTLLIADACFSGSIFKTRSAFDNAPIAIKKLQNLPSKTAMTSGNLMEVPDKSVFLKYLVQRLEENTDKYLPADKLFASFRIAVMNNSPNAPQFGTIQNAGDEGGEFIFVKRN